MKPKYKFTFFKEQKNESLELSKGYKQLFIDDGKWFRIVTVFIDSEFDSSVGNMQPKLQSKPENKNNAFAGQVIILKIILKMHRLC